MKNHSQSQSDSRNVSSAFLKSLSIFNPYYYCYYYHHHHNHHQYFDAVVIVINTTNIADPVPLSLCHGNG